MKRSLKALAWFAAALSAAILQPTITSARADETEAVKKVFASQLPNVPSNSLTAFVVNYARRQIADPS